MEIMKLIQKNALFNVAAVVMQRRVQNVKCLLNDLDNLICYLSQKNKVVIDLAGPRCSDLFIVMAVLLL